MNHITPDAEIVQLRQSTSCAAILERNGYQIDRAQSTRNARKYRRGSGEIVILNHQDRGWWNPLGEEKGDVFDLVQFLTPGLNFGQVRIELRRVAGIAPSFPEAGRRDKERKPSLPVAQRWAKRPALRRGCGGWHYLAVTRQIPAAILDASAAQDAVRNGAYGSVWFAHRDHGGTLTGIEARGPEFRGMITGGSKSLFRFRPAGAGEGAATRLATTEAPIDALSLAAIEGCRDDTIYVATTGGIGPGTEAALRALLAQIGARHGRLVIATDNDPGGDRHAGRLQSLADGTLPITRLRPPVGLKDWNQALAKETK